MPTSSSGILTITVDESELILSGKPDETFLVWEMSGSPIYAPSSDGVSRHILSVVWVQCLAFEYLYSHVTIINYCFSCFFFAVSMEEYIIWESTKRRVLMDSLARDNSHQLRVCWSITQKQSFSLQNKWLNWPISYFQTSDSLTLCCLCVYHLSLFYPPTETLFQSYSYKFLLPDLWVLNVHDFHLYWYK